MSLFARAAEYFGPTPEELAAQQILEAEQSWQDWLIRYYAPYTRDGFAPHHQQFWEWVWSMQRGLRPAPYTAVWGRGGAKSTSAELAVVALGARGRRRYCLYVSGTQDLADDHVANIATMLESDQLAADYPGAGNRLLSKFGTSKGWRRNRLRTASGFTIDAIGLDTAARGVKLEQQRPDLIVIDDVDAEDDTQLETTKKIRALTKKLLPSGSTDLAVLAIQNLIHPDSIFSQLVDGRAEFLSDRIVNGPVPAVRGLTYRTETGEDGKVHVVVTGGTPTWAGQSLTVVQGQIATWGLAAFLTEAQHEVEKYEGAWLDRDLLDEHRVLAGEVPVLPLIVTGVDPATTAKTSSNETGIVTAGVDQRGEGYVLDDASGRYSPDQWGRRTWEQVLLHGSQAVVVEDNAGGDMCEHTLKVAWKQMEREQLSRGRIPSPMVPIVRVHPSGASESKWRRAMPIGALYRQGRIHHVTDPDRDQLRQPHRLEAVKPGQVRITVQVDDEPDLHSVEDPQRDGLPALKKLEDQAVRWTGTVKETSPDRIDALVHALTWMLFPQRRATAANTPALSASDRWAGGDGRR
ncbi:MAG: hypothetical protein JWM40_2971 [Frankiales bacterium]|nr:hypothetical protein [Frankiales bacterium]